MAANETVVSTESEKKSSYKYVKKRTAQLKIKCRIEKFEALMNSTKPAEGCHVSEGISSELAPRAVWKLSVHPNGHTEQYKGNISVFLHLTGPMADKKETQQANFHLYLVDGSGKTYSIERSTDNFGEESYSWGSHASHDRLKKALHVDGSLLMAADIQFLTPDDDSAHQCDADQQQWPAKFSELRNDAASFDCSIEIGGVSIPAHKYPLMAHSPIFHRMFTRPIAEEFKSSVVKVTDFKEAAPMHVMIRYCYKGFLDDATMDGEWAVETFKLAEKYCIVGLKAQLERNFIDKTLSVENVVSMVVLADTYFAHKLKEACIKLIAQEKKTVFESADWKKLEEARPKLTTHLAVATCLKL